MAALATAFVKAKLDTSELGADADRAGRAAGERLANGLWRDAAGKLRNSSGQFATEAERQAAGIGDRTGKAMGQATSDGFGTFMRRAAGFAAALGAVGIVESAVRLGIQTAAGLEQAQIGFTTLLHSADAAKKFIADLTTFAKNTPFELTGLVQSSRLLIGVGLSADQTKHSLQAWGDAAGALGLSNEQFNRTMLALSQSIGAGKINAQDMNQIIQAGIPIWKLMSEATGKTVPELRKMSEEGKLLTADVLPKLEAQMAKDYGGAMAKQSQTLAGVWSNLKDAVAIGLAQSLQPLVPILTDLLPRGAALLALVLGTLSAGMAGLITGLRGGDVAGSGFGAAMGNVGNVTRDVVGVIRDGVGWFQRHHDLVVVLTSALGAAATAYTVITVATKAWSVAQGVLDALLAANPVGITVIAIAALVAILVAAYQRSDEFRAIVNTTFQTAKTVIAEFWASAGPTIIAFGAWLRDDLVPALLWLFDTQVRTWTDAYKVIAAAWQFIQPVIALLISAFQAVAATVAWVWQNIISPTLSAMVWYWQNVIAPAATWLWHNVFEPVMGGIGRVVQAMWIVVQIVFNILSVWITQIVAPKLFWLRDNVFAPVMDFIGNLVRGVWLVYLQPTFAAIGSFITDRLVPAFRTGVNAIGAAWDTLREKARTPVAFVVNQVINPLIGGFNRVAGFFGVTDKVATIGGFEGGGYTGPGSKHQPAGVVHAGEWVATAEETVRYRPLLEAMHAGILPGYEGGGLVEFITNPLRYFRNLANVDAVTGRFGSNTFTRTLRGAGSKLMDAAIAKAKGFIGSLTAGAAFGGAAPSGQLAQWIATAIALTGVPASWTGPLNTLIQRESGGNPNAINLTDINAQQGHPSQGLMQTIPSTFNAYRLPGLSSSITDPISNIVAGIRYILARYGSIFNVQQANASLPPRGYAMGGLVRSLSMDNGFGVLAPGRNIVDNGTGRPEPIAATSGVVTVRLDEWSVARVAQALATRPVRVAVEGPNDWGLTVAGVAL